MLIISPDTTYYKGRLEPIELVVIHTAQCPCTPGYAKGIMQYLARDDVRASAHYCVDPSTTVGGVAEEDTAWAAPSANANGIHVEQTAMAEFGRSGFMSWNDSLPQQMINEQLIPLVTDICRRRNLPPVLLEPADLRAGKKGITDHVRVSLAFGTGDHWDCGEHFPLNYVVEQVALRLNPITPVIERGNNMPDMILHNKTTDAYIGFYNSGYVRYMTWSEVVTANNSTSKPLAGEIQDSEVKFFVEHGLLK